MIEPQENRLIREALEFCQEGRFEPAAEAFARALRVRPDFPPALTGLGQCLLALDAPERALAIFTRLGEIAPGSDMASRGAGEALSQLGRFAEAREALTRAVALAPDVAGHHYALAQCARFTPGDARLAGLERLATKLTGLPPQAQCELHFALGKAYDELGRPAEAFAHWQSANRLRRRFLRYDEGMYLGILKDLAAAFPARLIKARSGAGTRSQLPVFVVGMPRSGTTLVEQILASHPQVFGGGESMELHRLAGCGLLGPDFPHGFAEVPDANLAELGARYLAHMQAKASAAPGASRILDKLTANFMLCGLIHLALPGARILHVRRDPLDTCLSCYANLFSQDFDYAYDLGELGRYWRAYDALMAHWRAVLPQGQMLEVSYEALVGDLETEARRMVDFCGLAWTPACLNFHKTDRVVHTLSSAQVRQPLYHNAVGRAAAYAPWLTPLRAALAAGTPEA